MPFRPLSQELQEKVKNDFGETPDKIKASVKYIREWIQTQPHLTILQDDQWLLNIIRCCKYNLGSVKEKLNLMCTIKSLLPEFFTDRDPFAPEIQESLKFGHVIPLPKTADPAAPRVILCRLASLGLTGNRIHQGIKLLFMIIDILLNEDDNCIISGGYLLIDGNGLTMNDIIEANVVVQKLLKYHVMKNGFPLRSEGIFLINTPAYIQNAFNMMQQFIDLSMLTVVQFYTKENEHEIYEKIPRSVLPEEYGGTGGNLAELTVQWKNKIESYKDWLMNDVQYFSDESKRTEKLPEFFTPVGFTDIMELD